ncbi:hypothetical protein [Gluconobacter cerinus]|uniref:hypothetical protein n=1 Tax=Gluconobacter cerinus TaxID=38307 RepID=UPI002011D514|nr:hypothetical protein [Gluconobacter cerinus]
MSGVSLPAKCRRRAERPASLPRWPMGRIRIVDIVPCDAGPLVAGREVIVASRDGFFESVDETSALSWWCAQIRLARCRLEQTLKVRSVSSGNGTQFPHQDKDGAWFPGRF